MKEHLVGTFVHGIVDSLVCWNGRCRAFRTLGIRTDQRNSALGVYALMRTVRVNAGLEHELERLCVLLF